MAQDNTLNDHPRPWRIAAAGHDLHLLDRDNGVVMIFGEDQRQFWSGITDQDAESIRTVRDLIAIVERKTQGANRHG